MLNSSVYKKVLLYFESSHLLTFSREVLNFLIKLMQATLICVFAILGLGRSFKVPILSLPKSPTKTKVFASSNASASPSSSSSSSSSITSQKDTDTRIMRQLVQSFSSKQPYKTSYPAPPSATLLYDTTTDQVLTAGISTFTADSTVNALNALPSTSLQITPLTEWSVNFGDKSLEDKIASGKIVLFTTVEPSVERRGTDPSVVDLIVALNFQRVVIGSPHPLPDLSMKAATRLHGQGLAVSVGCNALQTDALLEEYRCRVQHHLTSSGRKFRRRSGRPLGLLHCSVIKSSDEKAFER